ncbi:MAG: hypothetical protein EG826_19030, partial [Deltaproteobacteria bacterium]|nr:hypothetical protein [Deltaproteobacteria bacterium]
MNRWLAGLLVVCFVVMTGCAGMMSAKAKKNPDIIPAPEKCEFITIASNFVLDSKTIIINEEGLADPEIVQFLQAGIQ